MVKKSNLLLLVTLGILWSTFALFTKISTENLSPYFTVWARLILGGAMLYGACAIKGKKIFELKNFNKYFFIGLFNSIIPFILFAFASRKVDSGILAILDGTVPMFEVLMVVLIFKEHIGKKAIFGVLLSIIGIFLTATHQIKIDNFEILPIIMVLCGTASYAGASIYIVKKCKGIDPMITATGSVIMSALILSPSIFFTDFSVVFEPRTALSLAGLGFICTGLAYLIFFKLIVEEGSRFAVSSVLFIPVFGTIFGAIFLSESFTINKIMGCAMILISIEYILNISFKEFFTLKNKKTNTAKTKKIKVAILISGRGSNMQALIEASKDINYPAEIALVISNKKDALGLEIAQREGIKTVFIDHKNFKLREEFDAQMTKIIEQNNCKIICLAGFMRLLSDQFVNHWFDYLINIHPSLLPEFKGADAVGDALKAGAKISGCTVHFVREEMDCGPIILQERIEINEKDTKETLAHRILEKEHVIYKEALAQICQNLLKLKK